MQTSQAARMFLDTCHLIHAKGMVSGSGGNISLRCEDGILITPSGRSLESLKEEDLVILQPDGSFTCANGGRPSKEWRMHLACYGRDDVQAVVHVHSVHAVAVSCLKDVNTASAIPVYTPGYCLRVGDLPLLPYYKPGSLAVGRSMEEALNVVEEIEDEAKLFLLLGDRGAALSEEDQAALPPRGMRV